MSVILFPRSVCHTDAIRSMLAAKVRDAGNWIVRHDEWRGVVITAHIKTKPAIVRALSDARYAYLAEPTDDLKYVEICVTERL